MGSLFKPQISLVLVGLFTLAAVIESHAQSTFGWNLKGTGLDKGHAYAVLQNKETGKQQWVGVGQVIDEARVVRIDRARVVIIDQNNRLIDLSLAGLESEHTPPLLSSPKDVVAPGKDLNAFLIEEGKRILAKPLPTMTEADRRKLVEEITRVFDQGKIIPASTTLVIGGGEEWVTGAKTTTNIKSMGLQEKDLIIAVNGISPDSDKKKWENIFEVIKGAKLIIFSYLREEELHYKMFEVH